VALVDLFHGHDALQKKLEGACESADLHQVKWFKHCYY